jgi:hypothetical protein
VKTNRRDARKLVKLLRAGLLTEVRPPTPEEEAVRDLCRARDDAREIRSGVAIGWANSWCAAVCISAAATGRGRTGSGSTLSSAFRRWSLHQERVRGTHQRARRLEPAEVVQLGHAQNPAQSVDPTEAAQRRDSKPRFGKITRVL